MSRDALLPSDIHMYSYHEISEGVLTKAVKRYDLQAIYEGGGVANATIVGALQGVCR